jgi:hypothetical protein
MLSLRIAKYRYLLAQRGCSTYFSPTYHTLIKFRARSRCFNGHYTCVTMLSKMNQILPRRSPSDRKTSRKANRQLLQKIRRVLDRHRLRLTLAPRLSPAARCRQERALPFARTPLAGLAWSVVGVCLWCGVTLSPPCLGELPPAHRASHYVCGIVFVCMRSALLAYACLSRLWTPRR